MKYPKVHWSILYKITLNILNYIKYLEVHWSTLKYSEVCKVSEIS